MSGRPGRRWSIVIGGVLALVAATTVTVVAVSRTPEHGPSAPYDHPGFAEYSSATEEVAPGPSAVVVRGLREQGYWCVQPRGNDFAVQIACWSADQQVRVDLQGAANGDLLYADIDLPSSGATDRLWTLLDASFLRLWPQERSVIAGLLQDAQPLRFMGKRPPPPSDPNDQFLTHERRTSVASWSLWSFYSGRPLALRLRTEGLRDRSWPFGGDHYATTLSSATELLVADGFSCATSCYRVTDNQSVDFESHDDQIVRIHFTLRTAGDDDRVDDPSGRWVRSGLPFLSPEVRAAVGDRIEQSRLEHRDWHGVVVGTPVDIVAKTGASLTPDGHPAGDLSVQIGIPLLYVE